MLNPGSPAPDFAFTGPDGRAASMAALRGQIVVLFFYPRDRSLGCTAQACSFRDAHDDLRVAGATVLGISPDSGASHADFAARHYLPYALVSDPDGSIARAYGVRKTLGLIPGRATFVIDRGGIIRLAYSSQWRPKSHVEHARRAVAALSLQ